MNRMAQVAGLVVAAMVLLAPQAGAAPAGDRFDPGVIAGSMFPGNCVVVASPGGGPFGPSVTVVCSQQG